MKFLSFTLLALLCSALLSCGECKGAKNLTNTPTPPAVFNPTDGEQPSEQPDEQPKEEQGEEPEQETPPDEDGTSSEVFAPETNEPSAPSQPETPDEPPSETPPEETPNEPILSATEDTMETPPQSTLLYRFEANRAGTLSVVSKSSACEITVKKLAENGEQTLVNTPEAYAAQQGDVFFITVSNTSKKTVEWSLFLE